MKIKTTFTIAIFAVIMLSMTILGNAQENYYNQIKVKLPNNYYFLIPDSYIPTKELFPILEGTDQINKSYENQKIGAEAQFTAFKLPKNDQTLKEMGIEKYMTDKMSKKLNIKSAKTIEMNGRDTFFLRGETKQDYVWESYRVSSKNGSTSKSTSSNIVKLEVLMYIIKEDEYIYVTFYQTPTHFFATNLRNFLEIQNSFTNDKK